MILKSSLKIDLNINYSCKGLSLGFYYMILLKKCGYQYFEGEQLYRPNFLTNQIYISEIHIESVERVESSP